LCPVRVLWRGQAPRWLAPQVSHDVDFGAQRQSFPLMSASGVAKSMALRPQPSSPTVQSNLRAVSPVKSAPALKAGCCLAMAPPHQIRWNELGGPSIGHILCGRRVQNRLSA